jgi:hypothetical protein
METKFRSPEFFCPSCGGSKFSSSNCTASDRRNMLRHCTSFVNGKRCGFTFNASDDWRHFRIPGVRAFKNEDEYDLVMEIIRSVPVVGVPWRSPT